MKVKKAQLIWTLWDEVICNDLKILNLKYLKLNFRANSNFIILCFLI